MLAKRLIDGGNLAAAIQAIDAHEADHDRDPRATVLRGEIALLTRAYADAVDLFSETCETATDDTAQLAVARAGRGAAHYALGSLEASIDDLEVAIGHGERSTRAWLTMALARFALDRDEALSALAEQARVLGDLDTLTVNAVAAVAAIRAYAGHETDQVRSLLADDDGANEQRSLLGLEAYQRLIEAGIGGRQMPERRALLAALGYQAYLAKLIEHHDEAASPDAVRSASHLHLIGDSHVLSPAHTTIAYHGVGHRVVPHPVMGGKAWHLAPEVNPSETPQRKAFDRICAALPSDVPVVAMFGEIDCRVNEGLFPYLNAHPGQDRDAHCTALARSYVAYLASRLAGPGRQLLVYGVPAPHPVQAYKVGEGAGQFIDLVGLFNHALGQAARDAGLVFLDPHSLTANADGVASGDLHLDTIHLKPDCFGEILDLATSGAATT